MGLGGFSDPPIAIERLRTEWGTRWAAVGCARKSQGLRDRRERGPAAVSKTETSDEGTGNGTAIFNGWAIKWTPNATKLGRRPVYTIIRPHDKLQPIPRTFLCHL